MGLLLFMTDNEIIAEFVGLEKSELGEWVRTEGGSKFVLKEKNYRGLRFDTSWDCLMPVIEKIEQKRHTTDYPPEARLLWNELSSAVLSVNISRAYTSIIDNIKYYNNVN